MSRFFMQLSYRGEPYNGWQIQPEGITVQGVLEDALTRLLREKIEVTGAGRTDAGVNARMMIAHFDVPDAPGGVVGLPDAPGGVVGLPDDLLYRLNAMVGKDIAVQRIWRVADDAHARFDAKERTYRYYVATEKSPFLYPLSWRAVNELDFETMNQACRHLIGRQDFTSFSKLHTQVKHNYCDIRRAAWHPVAPGHLASPAGAVAPPAALWYFEVSADRFLRNMVRAIVGTLVDVGRHKIAPQEVARIIESRDRCAAGASMPGYALYLWDIKY